MEVAGLQALSLVFLCIMPFRLLFSFFFSEIMYILFTIRRRSRSISTEVREMLEGGV